MITLASKRKLDAEIADLKSQLTAKDTSIGELTKQLEDVKTQLSELQNKPVAEDPRVKELTDKLATLEKTNAGLVETMKDFQAKASAIAGQIVGDSGTPPIGVIPHVEDNMPVGYKKHSSGAVIRNMLVS